MISYTPRLGLDSLAIFLFHGVIENPKYRVRNYTRKHLPKDEFLAILQGLNQLGHAISMNEVVNHLHTKTPFPRNSFAITFDDGFENNFSIAAPILTDLKIPATFYLTTGFVEENRMSWIDQIEWLFETREKGSLRLPWAEKETNFNTVSEILALLNEIRYHIKKGDVRDVDAFVSDVFEQLDQNPIISSDDSLDRKITWAQIRQLGNSSLFLVGGHTHQHSIMAHLSPEKLENEIVTSLILLETKAGLKTQHYSYPEGLAHCYSPEVIAALKRHGIICCPTAIDGINWLGADPFHLLRIPVI